MKRGFPSLYPIVDRSEGKGRGLFELARAVLDGGAGILQIREKSLPSGELFREVERVLACAADRRALVIVNDRVDIAKASGADGVHLGREDLPPAAARDILGEEKIIGLSTHSLEEFEAALSEPVDYVAIGPVFHTTTGGKRRPPLGTGVLEKCAERATKPVVAIGGIGLGDVREVLARGADAAALISALMREDDIARAVRELI